MTHFYAERIAGQMDDVSGSRATSYVVHMYS